MKSMTCNQLGGACDKVFTAATFDEIAKLSQSHGMEMFKANDAPHLEAMNSMRARMNSPSDLKAWMDEKRAAFDALSED